jgi:hypothetical protein
MSRPGSGSIGTMPTMARWRRSGTDARTGSPGGAGPLDRRPDR